MKLSHHPLLPAPTFQMIQAEAARTKCEDEDALAQLLKRRRDVIDREQNDPFRFGWEPPIWKVADALIGWEWCDASFEREIKERFGYSWPQWCEALRLRLGFEQPLQMLLVMGANRSGKSEYAAKRCQQLMTWKENANVWAFHMSNPRSKREQQPLFWKYMPPEYKVQHAGVTSYVKFKEKTGFSENSFINQQGSACGFLNYQQDRDTALEGMEADFLAPDELIPPDWIETLPFRLATRSGRAVFTFTPINGYTPSVQIFCDSAEIAKESNAYLLPKDGGEPDEARALGLTISQYDEIWKAERLKRASQAPQCVPEDVHGWLDDKPSQLPTPEGRMFAKVPRVMRSVDPTKGVIFFYSSDNPYGNPKRVIESSRKRSAEDKMIRLYGYTRRAAGNIFAKFSKKVHVIDDESIPPSGTNYMLMDPAGDRNFFMTWIRATPEADYVYREWPGSYDIAGEGVPDPWSIPSGKKEGMNDGKRGGAQESFGWGYLRYKFEIARLERWHDYLEWQDRDGAQHGYPLDEEIEMWTDSNGADEIVEIRFVDSRAASNPRIENDRPVTLYEDFLDLNMDFTLTPGSSIGDGVKKIDSALDYDQDEDQTFFNRPKLLIARSCANTIYSLENWRNVDGDKGACKDPIDNLRYYYTHEDTGYVGEGDYQPNSGFSYGRGPQRRYRTSDGHPVKGNRPRPKRSLRAQRAIFNH